MHGDLVAFACVLCLCVYKEKCSFFSVTSFFSFSLSVSLSLFSFHVNARWTFLVIFLIRLICIQRCFCMNVMQAGYDDYQLTESANEYCFDSMYFFVFLFDFESCPLHPSV